MCDEPVLLEQFTGGMVLVARRSPRPKPERVDLSRTPTTYIPITSTNDSMGPRIQVIYYRGLPGSTRSGKQEARPPYP